MQKTLILNEEKKIANRTKLCNSLKLLGKCDSKHCKKRHVLCKQLDTNENTRYFGQIKFKIITVIDVSTYCVNVLEYTDANEQTKQNLYDKSTIEKQLTEIMNKERFYVDDADVSDWVALEDTDEEGAIVYRRCEVVKIIETDRITKKPRTVRVVLIDSGLVRRVHLHQLFSLPDEFKTIPLQGTTVHFANIVPLGDDRHFSSHCKTRTTNLLKSSEENHNEAIYQGHVVLQLGADLWLRNIQLIQQVSLAGTTLVLLDLKRELLKQCLAEYKEEPLERLGQLCQGVGIEVKKQEVKKREKRSEVKQVEPQWAFFDESVDYNEVYFSAGNTPDEFYVRLKKFQKQ